MADLEIRLLGSPRIDCDGAPLRTDTRKAVALLAYLAVTGEEHRRDRLAGLLWPESDPERARASLRRTLSVLLKGLGRRWVHVERDVVRFDPAGAWCDVVALGSNLRAAAEAADLEQRLAALTAAVSLYRGEFLEGFVLADSPAFDEWQFFTAETLRRDLAGALEALVDGCAEVGDLHAATTHARRWLALDPLHEPAHRQLMQLYAWAGRRQAALRQYRECVRALRRELGVAPLEETTALYEAIRHNQLTPAPAGAGGDRLSGSVASSAPSVGSTVAPRSSRLPFVGRDAELARVRAAVDAGCVIGIEGEPGIGKTRLVEELMAGDAAGRPTLAVRCYDGEQHLAYSAVVELLRSAVTVTAPERLAQVPAHWWAEAARLMPELADRAPDAAPAAVDAPGAATRLRAALAGLLHAAARSEPPAPPGLLIIDDAHWLDAACLEVLAYLVRRLHHSSLALVLGWRTELVPAGHPLRRLLDESASSVDVVLARLDAASVDRLIDDIVPDMCPEGRARLVAETEGVPFFVVEYLTAYHAGSETDWMVGGSVRLLDDRLAAVDETARQLLTAAAVIGRSFDMETLRMASGRGEDETVAGLDSLVAAGLVREQAEDLAQRADATFDFAHHKLRQRALAGTSLARRRLLHRRVAGALAARPRARDATAALRAQIAGHYAAAGDDQAAALAYAEAGEAAAGVHATTEALAHYEAAIGLGHPDPARLYAACGDLHAREGADHAAAECYETAAAFAGPTELVTLERRLAEVHDQAGGPDAVSEQPR